MSVPEKITNVLKGPVNHQIKPAIVEIGEEIKNLPEGALIIPEYAFEVMGISENSHPGYDFVGGKEYYYFENCSQAVAAFLSGDYSKTQEFLMKAKWDFDNWALAHYLLGCLYLNNRSYKAAFDQFEQGCDFEPFNHRPAAVMREIARYLVLNP